MASVTLNELWIHDADDLSDYVRVRVSELSAPQEQAGEVREYAGGRRRIIRRKTRRREVSVELSNVDREVLPRLDDWAGRLLMLRDPRGRVMWGSFFSFSVEETRGLRDRVTVGFTFHQVFHDQEV